MDSPKPKSRSFDTSTLHEIVLDYISNNAYASTARVISQSKGGSSSIAGPTPVIGETSTSMLIDGGDGVTEEEAMDLDTEIEDHEGYTKSEGKKPLRRDGYIDAERLESIERRAAILNHILNGAILRAVEALNTHFPDVLASHTSHSNGSSSYSNGHSRTPSYSNGNSNGNGNGNGTSHSSPNDYSLPVFHTSLEPRHVKLNLEIQQFIENFRQLSPSPSSSPSSSMSSILSQPSNGLGNSRTLAHALAEAQGLHVEAKRLLPEERAVYLEEIKDAGALFAYTNPETSILKGFLEQGRRIALAKQVNGAILKSEGQPVQSQLESLSRRVTALYSLLAENKIDTKPPWTGADGQGKEQLAMYWKHHFKDGFKLKDFVNHTWG